MNDHNDWDDLFEDYDEPGWRLTWAEALIGAMCILALMVAFYGGVIWWVTS